MSRVSLVLSIGCLVAALIWPCVPRTKPQTEGENSPDLLEQKIGRIVLANEFFVDGLAKINMQAHGVGFSIEFLPGSPPPPDSRFTADKGPGILKDALDWLCGLDPRYTWKLKKRTVNIIPRDRLSDPKYLFNRKLPALRFVDLRSANDTLDKIFRPVARQGESVISLGDAGSFSKSWTATFENITVRDALDAVAEHLGEGHGWIVYGDDNTRLINFYDLLLTKAEAEKRKRTQILR